ncbi:hypothetical protein [Cupriavidus sp. AU9028]|uniref:hypothetical protein n=1 Tax=Cupriavidus sp. AU9028 TaxID=2871157 RepID=UPI001C95B9D7|nr:hypothetical protein [Cupriavidus sp. AU9028]MBY4897158.1 hypothetical protein [Cupriavidus sp. AU9028]
MSETCHDGATAPKPPCPDEHASVARFFLQKGLDFNRPDMVAVAVQAAREAVVLFSGAEASEAGHISHRAVLRRVPPVVLTVYRDALAASGTAAEAGLVDAVLAEIGAARGSRHRH